MIVSFVCTLPSTIAPLLSKFLYFQIASSQSETVFPINASLRRWHKYEIAAKTLVHLQKKKIYPHFLFVPHRLSPQILTTNQQS